MPKYDAWLIEKVGLKLDKEPDYIREQISRRALRHNVSPEAELANWARSLKISADQYVRGLPANIQDQIYSRPAPNHHNPPLSTNLRIIRIGKKEGEWYDEWWIQWFVAGVLIATISGTFSQIIGVYFTNLLGLTKP